MNAGLYIFISDNQKQSENNVNQLACEVFMSNTSFYLCKMWNCLEWILPWWGLFVFIYFYFPGLSFPRLDASNKLAFSEILRFIIFQFFLTEMIFVSCCAFLLFLFMRDAMWQQWSQNLLACSVSPIAFFWVITCWRHLYLWSCI